MPNKIYNPSIALYLGVTQILNMQNYNSKQSSFNIVSTSGVNENSKDAKRREVQTNQLARFCPSETPEGQGISLVSHRAITAHTSFKGMTKNAYEKLLQINRDLNKEMEKESKRQKQSDKKTKFGKERKFSSFTSVSSKKENNQDDASVKRIFKNKILYNYHEIPGVMINNDETTDLTYNLFSAQELSGYLTTTEKQCAYQNKRLDFINNVCSSVKIFLNMNIIGFTKNPKRFVEECKKSKMNGKKSENAPDMTNFTKENDFELPLDCSISFDTQNREIHIRTNPGRMCRPLLVSIKFFIYFLFIH